MAIVSLTSAVNTSPSQTLPLGNDNSSIRDASFSAYLNGTEEAFVRSLMPVIMTTREEQKSDVGRKKEDDEEIGVFGAEKYFKGGLMDPGENPRSGSMSAKKHQHKKAERVDPAMKYRIQPRTPSVQSDQSSWNSQSALLQNGLRNIPPSRTNNNTNKVRRKTILAGLGCKYCSCSDKDSVEIKQQREQRKTDDLGKLGVGLNRDNCFAFPTSNSGAGSTNLPIKLQFQEEKGEKLRKSMEVFGSPVMEKRNKSLSIERRLTMLSWDANTPRLEEIECGNYNNDTESDASSDLFEIESFAGNPTTCYEPSEASIEWSVVTASAADFSAMSDCEELRPTSTKKTDAKAETNKEIQRRRSGILLGCKSQKAVQVAGDAYRTNEKANNVYPPMHRRSDHSFNIPPVTRFRAETMSTGFSARRSESPRASHLLYIQ